MVHETIRVLVHDEHRRTDTRGLDTSPEPGDIGCEARF